MDPPCPLSPESDSSNSSFSTSCESVNVSSSSDDEDSVGDPDEFSKSLMDFRSIQFSPVLALKSNLSDVMTRLPDPKAPKYLNLSQYDKAVPCPSEEPLQELQLKPVGKKGQKIQQQSSIKTGAKSKDKSPFPSTSKGPTTSSISFKKEVPQQLEPQNYPMPGRKFLPHQMPVFRPRKEAPNALVIMETITGPLEGLRNAMKAQRRVKVWTRNESGIRGFVTGFIEAFDKHWNLALRDVDEQFQRKRRIKYPCDITGTDGRVTEKRKLRSERESVSTRSRTRSSTRDSTRDITRDSTRDIIKNSTRDSTRDSTRSSTRDSSRSITRSITSTRDTTRDSINNSTKNSPRRSTRSSPRRSPRRITRSSPRRSPRRITRNSPRRSTRNSPRRSTRSNSRSSRHSSRSSSRSSRKKIVEKPTEKTNVPMAGSTEDLMNLYRIGISNLSLNEDKHSKVDSKPETKVVPQKKSSSVIDSDTVPQPPAHTKSAVRKKGLTIFKKPSKDVNGFTVIAQSKKYEIVERHVGQLFLMGNDVVFIEMMKS